MLATSNTGKVAEFRSLLGEDVRVLSLVDIAVEMPEETGTTFQENSELKAVSAAVQSGLITLADDSGLEVDALDGKPGVWSARFASLHATDAENRSKLLKELEGIPPTNRSARFVCALSVANPEGSVWTELGVLEGTIIDRERGESGFGYDSLFETADGRTLAEVSSSEKNAISHRGMAVRRALPRITHMLPENDQVLRSSHRRVERP